MVTMLGYNPSQTLEHQSHEERTPIEEITGKVLSALRGKKMSKDEK